MPRVHTQHVKFGIPYCLSLSRNSSDHEFDCAFLDGEEEDHDGAESDGRMRRTLPVDERVDDSLRRPHLGGG